MVAAELQHPRILFRRHPQERDIIEVLAEHLMIRSAAFETTTRRRPWRPDFCPGRLRTPLAIVLIVPERRMLMRGGLENVVGFPDFLDLFGSLSG